MKAEDNELVARATRVMLERTARTVGAEFFRAMARGIAEVLGTRYGFVGELVDVPTQTIRTLAVPLCAGRVCSSPGTPPSRWYRWRLAGGSCRS